MKAIAVLILALAASAQAFPGSDPVSTLMAVEPEELALHAFGLLKNNPVICVIGYVKEVSQVASESLKNARAALSAVAQLGSDLKQCISSEDKLVCAAQAVRDAWEGNTELREKFLELAVKLVAIADQIKTDCFASKDKSAAFRDYIRPLPIRTLPIHVEN